MAVNPDPAYLVETLPAALREVTGRDFEVMDRSVSDVTGIHLRRAVMIRDGDVGLWPGYDSRRYSLLSGPKEGRAARAALAEPPARMSGWEPPGPPGPPASARRYGRPRHLGQRTTLRPSTRSVGRQSLPREQWLAIGAECPTCGELVKESDVYTWRPSEDDPKLLLLNCPECGERLEIHHI